jgi:hypothetical protein
VLSVAAARRLDLRDRAGRRERGLGAPATVPAEETTPAVVVLSGRVTATEWSTFASD